MVKHKRVRQQQQQVFDTSCSDTSSDSSSDEGEPQLLLGRYQQADIAHGLRQRELRLAAVQELQEVLDRGLYSSADKKTQQAVFDDLLVAAQQRDSRVRLRQASSALLSAARRVLPQKQRQVLAKAEKQAGVAASRAARKQAAGGAACSPGGMGPQLDCCGDEEDDATGVVFSDVPLQVVSVILQCLDPVSLAAAACVCRSWHQLATCDECWQQHLQAAYPRAAAQAAQQQQQQQQQQRAGSPPGCAVTAGVAGSCSTSSGGGAAVAAGGLLERGGLYLLFGAKARKHPARLLRWKACRALVPVSNLQWRLPPAAAAAETVAAGGDALHDPGARGRAGHAANASGSGRRAEAAVPTLRLRRWHRSRRHTATPLTPAQAVRWMLGFNGRAVTCGGEGAGGDGEESDSSSSDGSDDDGSDAGGSSDECAESHTAVHSALRLWSIVGRD